MSVTSKGSKVLDYDGILERDWDKASYIVLFAASLVGMSEGSWAASYVSAIGSFKWYLITIAIAVGSMLLGLVFTRATTARRSQARNARLEKFINELITFSKKRYGITITQEQARLLVASSNHNKIDVLYSRRGLHYPSEGKPSLFEKKKVTALRLSDGASIEIKATAVEGRDWRILAADTGRELDRI